MRDVARGDLRPKPALQSKDEIGGLTRSFAVMTQQLADARSDANRNLLQLDAARSNLQTILDNLTSGVIVLDRAGRIVLSNPGATRILRAPMAVFQGKRLRDVSGLQDFARVVQEQFEIFWAMLRPSRGGTAGSRSMSWTRQRQRRCGAQHHQPGHARCGAARRPAPAGV
jgi:nitrogen fixation/metabolism regulation signal transduction histidine kinase